MLFQKLPPLWLCFQWSVVITAVSVCVSRGSLIDAAAAAQTHASQRALMSFVNFDDDSAVENAERYLLATSFSTHPSEDLLRDVMVNSDHLINKYGS